MRHYVLLSDHPTMAQTFKDVMFVNLKDPHSKDAMRDKYGHTRHVFWKESCGQFYQIEEYDEEDPPDLLLFFDASDPEPVWEDEIAALQKAFDAQKCEEEVVRQICARSSENKTNELATEYAFEMKVVNEFTYYEIRKPNTDLPYCTRLRTSEGHYDLFTNLYVNTTWGRPADNAFMVQLWEFLKMPGECMLEEMVKKRVERCFEGEEEPRVYRLFMDDFIEMCAVRAKRKYIKS